MRNTGALRRTILLLFLAGAMWGTNYTPSALGGEGGPTGSCEYTWTDSNSPSPVVSFSWIDIQANGTRITSWEVTADDGYAGPLPLGFDFSLYGTTFSEVFVGTNGYVSFGSGHLAIPSTDIPIPSTLPPDGFAMGYGADLNPSRASAPAGVYYEQLTAPNRFVVAYHDVPHFPDSDPVTFEIVLYENSEIWFQYLSLNGTVNVVGIEDLEGTTGTSYGGALSDNLAIRFQLNGLLPAPVGVFVSPCAQSVSALPGAQVDASLNVTNVGTMGDDTFDVSLASPSGWSATFYEADGTTLLSDTDANSTPDTGVVMPGNSTGIVLRIDVPTDASAAELITVTATSSVNASLSSSADIRVKVPPTIASAVASAIPTIDGVYSPGEWGDAFLVDLAAIPLNDVPGLLLAKNDFETLYVAYDATGDTTADLLDVGSIAFDTDHDGLATDGREDQFLQGGLGSFEQAHAVYDSSVGAWILEDGPYDPSLPNHAGLESAWGFGPSDNSPTDHRIYEFAIPLSLVGATPGDTLGFFGGTQFVPGLFDSTIGSWSTWPVWTIGPLALLEYGTLNVGPAVPPDHDVAVTGLQVPAYVLPNTTIPVNASIRNRGINDETAVLVNLTVDGAVRDSSTLTLLANGTSAPVSFSWAVPPTEGAHRVGIQVGQVPSEDLTFNNERARNVIALKGPPPGRLALISDGTQLGVLTVILDALGLGYDVLNGNALLENTEDIDLLLQYEAVVYYTTLGMGRAEQEVLEGYIQLGGKLLITGFDSLFFRSALADLVRSTSTGDHRFVSAFSVRDGSHPIANGAFGAFPTGTSLNAVVDNHDLVEADTTRGARAVAELTGGADKIIVTELPSGGIVTYWNGEGTADWTGDPNLEILFKNLVDWYVTGPPDVVPPMLTISFPTKGAFLGTRDVFVSWTAADRGVGLNHIEVRLDGSEPAILSPTASNHTLFGVSDGDHGITVTAVDLLGNSQNATVNVTVDTMPPSLSISAPSFGGYLATTGVEVRWTAADETSGIAGFEVSLDGAFVVTLGPTATGLTFSGVPEGSHTITVAVLDLAGQTQTASVDFTVDRTAPIVFISAPTAGSIVNSGSPALAFFALDTTSGVERLEVTLDGGPPITLPPTASSHTLVGLADGVHAIQVTAVDRAGNAASAIVEFSVDTSFLSPTGPFGVIPLIGIGVGAAAAALVLILYLRKRASERSAGGNEEGSP